MTIALLGDSLLDTGNLDALLDFIGIDPFPAPVYSEGKASNGLVLGEAIVAQFGIAPESIELGFRLLPTLAVDPLEQSVNYAVAGAAAGAVGAAGNGLQLLPVGLQTQVEILALDLVTAGALLVPANERPDLILSAGSNDVLEALVDLPALADILFSPETDDDTAFMQTLVSQIVGDIQQAIARLDGLVDDVVILGIPPLGDTPFAIQMDSQVDELLVGDFAGVTAAFLTDTVAAINAELAQTYDGDRADEQPLAQTIDDLLGTGTSILFDAIDAVLTGGIEEFGVGGELASGWSSITDFISDIAAALVESRQPPDPVENVMVIDTFNVFEAGLNNWQASLPAASTAITDRSYQDYLTQLGSSDSGNLPDGLGIEQFAFIDGVHSTEALNLELATLVKTQIAAEFPDFG